MGNKKVLESVSRSSEHSQKKRVTKVSKFSECKYGVPIDTKIIEVNSSNEERTVSR